MESHKNNNQNKKKKMTLDELQDLKVELHRQIEDQKEQVSYSAQQFVASTPLLNSFINTAAPKMIGETRKTNPIKRFFSIIKAIFSSFGLIRMLIKSFKRLKA